jgi:ABC-2 type transport system permease protein
MFLALAFLIPILWMLVFGYGMVLDVEHIPYAVLDRDHSALSRDYLYRFQQSRYFEFNGTLPDEAAADPLLAAGRIRAAIIIPEQFQERLLAGQAGPSRSGATLQKAISSRSIVRSARS